MTNYYHIHKNKKRRKSIARQYKWVNPAYIEMTLTGALSAAKISNIQSQPLPKYKVGGIILNAVEVKELRQTKGQQAVEVAIQAASKIMQLTKQVKINNFKHNRRYERYLHT